MQQENADLNEIDERHCVGRPIRRALGIVRVIIALKRCQLPIMPARARARARARRLRVAAVVDTDMVCGRCAGGIGIGIGKGEALTRNWTVADTGAGAGTGGSAHSRTRSLASRRRCALTAPCRHRISPRPRRQHLFDHIEFEAVEVGRIHEHGMCAPGVQRIGARARGDNRRIVGQSGSGRRRR